MSARTGSARFMSDDRRRAFLDLIRATFQESEFKTQAFADVAGLSVLVAQRDLLRLFRYGDLTRRREPNPKGNFHWLYSLGSDQKAGVLHWRKKDCMAIPDQELERIARGAVRRFLERSSLKGVDYNDLLSVALQTAFEDCEALHRNDVKVAAPWQATVVWNRCSNALNKWAKKEFNRRKIFNDADVDYIAARDNVYKAIEREEIVEALYNAVVDAAIEVAPEITFNGCLNKLEQGEPLATRASTLQRAGKKIGEVLFDIPTNEELVRVGASDYDRGLINGSGIVDKHRQWSARQGALRRVYSLMIGECINGEREIPRRDLKNLNLFNMLNEVF